MFTHFCCHVADVELFAGIGLGCIFDDHLAPEIIFTDRALSTTEVISAILTVPHKTMQKFPFSWGLNQCLLSRKYISNQIYL